MYLRQILISFFVAAALHVLVASGLLNQAATVVSNKINQAAHAIVINRFLSDGIVSLGVLFVARDYLVSKYRGFVDILTGRDAVCEGDRC